MKKYLPTIIISILLAIGLFLGGIEKDWSMTDSYFIWVLITIIILGLNGIVVSD